MLRKEKWAAAIEHFARAGEIPGDYPRNFSHN